MDRFGNLFTLITFICNIYNMNEIELKRKQLISLIVRYGYPVEFGCVLADELRTEKQMKRMIGYLLNGKPNHIEEIADELLAIKADFASYQQKKITEYNNQKYNELLAERMLKDDDES